MNKLISVCDVKEIYPTDKSDRIVSAYIDVVQEKMGDCVDAAYSRSLALLIKANMVAHLLAKSDGQRVVSSVTAPNGASTSFESSETRDGMYSTQYGRTVLDLDTSDCWTAMIANQAVLFTFDDGVESIYDY